MDLSILQQDWYERTVFKWYVKPHFVPVPSANSPSGTTGICDRVMECLARLKSAQNGTIQRLKPNDPRIPRNTSSTTSLNSQTMIDNNSLPKPSPINHLTSSSSGQSQQAGFSGGSNSSPASNTLNREHSTMQIANILLDNASHTTALGSIDDIPDVNVLPFEGYNLEELWDWMDSGGDVGGFEKIDWTTGTGFEDH
jgi:hypothetical protein